MSYAWYVCQVHTVASSIELPAAPAVVWAVISDLRRYGEWNVTHVGFPDGPPDLVRGARYRERLKIMGIEDEADWEITEVETGHRFALAGRGPLGVRLTASLTLSPSGSDATTLSYETAFGHGPLRGLFGKAVARRAASSARESLALLERLLVAT